MNAPNKKLYVPPRNLVGALVPTIIVTWYFIDKIGDGNSPLKIALVFLAVVIQVVVVAVSSRTRKTRRPFFWGVYDFLTGNGRLPLRLFVNGLVAIFIIALGFEISGLERINPVPSSFIARYVEVDIYWTALNFLGISDNSISPIGFSQVLTVIATITGLIFWGMYISILINKHAEIQNLGKNNSSIDEVDTVLFNEPGENSGNNKDKSASQTPDNSNTENKEVPFPPGEKPAKQNSLELSALFSVSGLIFWSLGISLLLLKFLKRKER